MIPGCLVSTLLSTGDTKPVGQQEFVFAGLYNYTVPVGVTSMCAVCIGAGALGAGALSYTNDFPVTPGESLTIIVPTWNSGEDARIVQGGSIIQRAASPAAYSYSGGNAVGSLGGTKFSGGNAGNISAGNSGGGGGTAGYTTDGDNGSNATVGIHPSRVGGGVGIYGGGIGGGGGGGNSSIPTIAGTPQSGGVGVIYGAGGTTRTDTGDTPGGAGAVRLIWGANRAFPNTNTGDL